MSELTATFRKLRDETWGIQVKGGEPTVGEPIEVSLKSGETKTVVVDAVVARFDDAILCSISDAPVSAAKPPNGEVPAHLIPEFPPTNEQEEGLRIFREGEDVVIEAGAGTGKTQALIFVALDGHARGLRGQYVAFNNAIVGDTAGKFPSSVECNTAHSLAVRAIGREFFPRQKSGMRMKSWEIAKILRINPVPVTNWNGEHRELSATFLAGHVINSIRRFCQTADREPTWKHVGRIDNLDDPNKFGFPVNDEVARALEPALKRAWKDLSRHQGDLPFTLSTMMAVVLKLWQLSAPKINADYILFDEAQDASPVMVDVIRQQTAQVVWVGDSNQQIYSFTGAINALAGVPAKNRTMLTQSFRFGPAVAAVANEILATLPTDMVLSGFEKIESVVREVEAPRAILTRTNATAIRAVMSALAGDRKPFLVGGGAEIARFCRAAADLQDGHRVDHPELGCFENWGEVQEYVENDEQGGDLRLMVKLIDEFGVETILEAVNGISKEKDADLVVSTAHKSKGRQWETVRLGGDFPEAAKMNDEERRLLYVAVTRAQIELDVTAVEFFNPKEAAA